MKNLFMFSIQRIIDRLTGKLIENSADTDINIAGNQSTPSSAGTFTLTSFSVPAGSECVIGDVDFGAAAAGTAEVTLTYKNILGTSTTISRYIYLGAAGFINEEHDFVRRPFLAFYNPTTSSAVTVNMNVLSAAASTQYTGNMAYILRTFEA